MSSILAYRRNTRNVHASETKEPPNRSAMCELPLSCRSHATRAPVRPSSAVLHIPWELFFPSKKAAASPHPSIFYLRMWFPFVTRRKFTRNWQRNYLSSEEEFYNRGRNRWTRRFIDISIIRKNIHFISDVRRLSFPKNMFLYCQRQVRWKSSII